MAIDKSVAMALGVAALGGAVKIYAKNSVTVPSDQKSNYDSVANYALYAGLGLAALFYFTAGQSGWKEF
jgi:hypothetical protein